MKILLLGDSIRMGYGEHVAKLMEGKAQVFYPRDNGRFLQYTLRELQDWKWNLHLQDGVDVVHWGTSGISARDPAQPERPRPQPFSRPSMPDIMNTKKTI